MLGLLLPLLATPTVAGFEASIDPSVLAQPNAWSSGPSVRRDGIWFTDSVGKRRCSTRLRVDGLAGDLNIEWRGHGPEILRISRQGSRPLKSGSELLVSGSDGSTQVRLYHEGNAARYDILLPAGQARTRLYFDGALATRPVPGGFQVETPLGTTNHRDLRAFQTINGKTIAVGTRVVAQGRTGIDILLGKHDATRPVVVDPIVWSTTFTVPKSLRDPAPDVQRVVSDLDGTLIVAGNVGSPSLPTTPGVIQVARPGESDAYIARFASNGRTLLACTYLGGTHADRLNALALAADGSILAGGTTVSHDFPTTADAAVPTIPAARGDGNGWVSHLSADLTKLVWSTYVGGTAFDQVKDVAPGADGTIAVGGETDSTDFRITKRATQTAKGGGRDAFLVVYSPSYRGPIVSTYLGGEGNETLASVCPLPDGTYAMSGSTTSLVFPTRAGVDPAPARGPSDAFLARMEAHGLLLQTIRYGGSAAESASRMVFQTRTGRAPLLLLAGNTTSDDLPVTSGTFRIGKLPSPARPAGYVAAFSLFNYQLVWAGRVAGKESLSISSIGLMADKSIVITGSSGVTALDTLDETYQDNPNFPSTFVGHIEPDGSAISGFVRLGDYRHQNFASPFPTATGVDVVGVGPSSAAVVGMAAGQHFVTTLGAYQEDNNPWFQGTPTVSVLSFGSTPAMTGFDLSSDPIIGGSGETLRATVHLANSSDAAFQVFLSTSEPLSTKYFFGQFPNPRNAVLIPKSRRNFIIPFTPSPVFEANAVTLTVTKGGQSFTAMASALPPDVDTVTLSTTKPRISQGLAGSIHLRNPAGRYGQVVPIRVVDASGASVLDYGLTALVAKGGSQVAFTVSLSKTFRGVPLRVQAGSGFSGEFVTQ